MQIVAIATRISCRAAPRLGCRAQKRKPSIGSALHSSSHWNFSVPGTVAPAGTAKLMRSPGGTMSTSMVLPLGSTRLASVTWYALGLCSCNAPPSARHSSAAAASRAWPDRPAGR
ncbi:hypothetical protein G6F24_015530 [Rhizopus arrhizus]|nr:hypothetical protein G6F24_015530 [Rhizopus arrhizus]